MSKVEFKYDENGIKHIYEIMGLYDGRITSMCNDSTSVALWKAWDFAESLRNRDCGCGYGCLPHQKAETLKRHYPKVYELENSREL